MKKQEAANTFSDGLILDLNPLTVPNTALTNCLNGTFLTYNGNENVLLNDMGNARVETAMLPTGYIPLGSASFGGIIYIVSYNPIDKKCLIGSFPSPERNLTKDELRDESIATIELEKFLLNPDVGWKNYTKSETGEYKKLEDGSYVKAEEGYEGDKYTLGFGSSENIISNYYQKVNLCKSKIYAGDKYKVFSSSIDDLQSIISGWDKDNDKCDVNKFPKYLKFEIISTLDDGKIIELTDNSVWTTSKEGEEENPYYIYNGDMKLENGKINIDEYRGLVGSNYDTYLNKLSGKLGIVAKLEVPTSFSVSYDVIREDTEDYLFYFYVNWANDNISDDHKNRINPSSILYTVENKKISSDIKLKTTEGEEKIPDTLSELDYVTTVAPENYYKLPDKIYDYLINLENTFDLNIRRRNDGSDFLYVIKGPKIKITKGAEGKLTGKLLVKEGFFEPIELNDNILEIIITPCMPFGQLLFLERKISLDVTKISTGEINLHNYLYYNDEDSINMNFLIEAYPETGQNIYNGKINLYPLYENVESEPRFLEQATYDKIHTTSISKNGTPITLWEFNSGIINGPQQITKNRNEIIGLVDNRVYIAEIALYYGFATKNPIPNRFFYRLFFNSNIFNNAYSKEKDFKDLYLYDPNTNYGLKPSLNLDSGADRFWISLDIKAFPKYKESSVRIPYNITYSGEHDIKSSFTITSNLGNSLKLNTSVNGINHINVTIPELIEGLRLREYNNPKYNLENNKLNLENKFKVVLPYTIDYSKPLEALICSLVPLTDGATDNKIIMLHAARKEDFGRFQLYINNTNAINKHENFVEEFNFPDGTRDVTQSIQSWIDEVGHLLSSDYDFLTVVFGIARNWDREAAYGYKISGKNSYSKYWKTRNNYEGAYSYFCKMTLVRTEDSYALIHAKNVNGSPLKLTCITRPNGWSLDNGGEDNFRAYRDYGQIFGKVNGEVIPSKVVGDEYISDYKKYQITGDTKTLYFINENNLNYIEDPSITLQYDINLLLNTDNIQIEGKTINLTYKKLASNLTLNGLDKFETNILVSQTLETQKFILDHLHLDNDNLYWDSMLQLPISLEEINYVRDNNNKILKALIIKDNVLYASREFLNNSYITTWVFGWEEILSGKRFDTSLTENEFREHGQTLWYNIEYTYATDALQTSELVDTGDEEYLLYTINSDAEYFVKNNIYTFTILRVNLPINFSPININVICEGGVIIGEDGSEIKESIFNDTGEEVFSTTILIKPITNDVTIILNLTSRTDISDEVGASTFSALDSEPVITEENGEQTI